MKSWRDSIHDAALSGSVACLATAATAAACGRAESRSALAPINAISHVVWGDEANQVLDADLKHTAPALAINEGASIFWATLYERFFGDAADKGDVARAFLGGGAIAALAYVTDYHVVPTRLTPGWENRLSEKSLALVYAALGLSFPVRGIIRRTLARRGEARNLAR
jgi:hypothetical protein